MKCPTCDKPINWKDNPFRPFCSERCKLIDFGAWVNGDYAVPAEESAPSLEDLGQNQSVPGETDSSPNS